MKKYFLSFLFLFVFSAAFPQQRKIDSLINLVKKDKEDTNKVNHLNVLSRGYMDIGSYDSALRNTNVSLILAQKIGFKNGEGDAYNNIGGINYFQSNFPLALENHLKALKIREEIDNKRGMADSYNNIGIVYRLLGNYPPALENYLKALEIAEKINYKKGIANSYNNIGNIFEYQGNHSLALENMLKSLKIKEEIGDKKGVAGCYSNIGFIYKMQGDSANIIADKITSANKYSLAIKNLLVGLSMKKEIGDKNGIEFCFWNLAGVYESQGNFSLAMENYGKAMKIAEEINDKQGVSKNYNSIGKLYKNQKQFQKAIEYSEKGLKLSMEIGSKDDSKDAYQNLSDIYFQLSDYKNAFFDFQLYSQYKDSLINEKSVRTLGDLKTNFEIQKKESEMKAMQEKMLLKQEKEVAIAQEKSRKQQIVIWSVIGGLLLMIVFAGFILRSQRITRRQKTIIEEHQKEIVDSINYAKRIQYTLLAHEELLKGNLNDHFVLFKPKDIVSGDFYWATKKENRFYLACCDCTGHGVPGAFMSLLNISFLNEAIIEKNISEPNEVLNHVRERLIQNVSQDGGQDGMDAILICVEENHISYAAANNAPVIIHNGKLKTLSFDKMPVGKGEKTSPFTLHTIDLQKGDSLYLFTDGYADQFGGPKGKKFKYKQLEELLISVCNESLSQQSEIIEQKFIDWKGPLEQVDDVCIIGIRG